MSIMYIKRCVLSSAKKKVVCLQQKKVACLIEMNIFPQVRYDFLIIWRKRILALRNMVLLENDFC